MKKKFDPTKPVRTKAGEPARIIATDAKSERPIIALIDNGRREGPWAFLPDGRSNEFEETSLDLENLPEKIRIEGWLNIYRNEEERALARPTLWNKRSDADQNACRGRIACIKVSYEITEGEGL